MKTKLAGMGGAPAQTFVDDVFSTYLYTGNGSTQTITNGIDLAGKGGLVWFKDRPATNSGYHNLMDTVRGLDHLIFTNTTLPDLSGFGSGSAGVISSFNSTGYTLGSSSQMNPSGDACVSWTFRKAAKFFDVVTYTGNGVAGRQIAHSLGVAPGMVIVKQTDSSSNWFVYHRSNGNTGVMYLNGTDAVVTGTSFWNSQDPTSTAFYVGGGSSNINGGTFVAYLFAHDTSSTGIIQCGSYSGAYPSVTTVNLGWEPQYVIYKNTSTGADPIKYGWNIADSMRGWTTDGVFQDLRANVADAESGVGTLSLTATGFTASSPNTANSGDTYIYMAIRRQNKPPTSGTQVYNAIARTGTGAAATVTGVGFTPDLQHSKSRSNSGYNNLFLDRLRGSTIELASDSTYAEAANSTGVTAFTMDGVTLGGDSGGYSGVNVSGQTYINHMFKRAPGFFDEVCYTGTGVATTQAHNLGVAPELMIVKSRSNGTIRWVVYDKSLSTNANLNYLFLNEVDEKQLDAGVMWNSTAPTSSVFSIGVGATNASTLTYVAYLFATLAGISKVGSYTGNGTSQNIDCGFAAGARFVLIKCTSTTGDWYVWDSARGIVSANDPHLSLNTTAAEVTTDDSVDPYSAGFAVNQVAATNINVSSATYIFLAIA